MTNREIATVLFNISVLLQRQNANRYRIRAYRRAALRLLAMRREVADLAAAGLPLNMPRQGASLNAKIIALALTGRLPFYDQLCAGLTPAERRLLAVPGIGPTLAARIVRDLGPDDTNLAERVRSAAEDGSLRRIWGIGRQRSAALLSAIR